MATALLISPLRSGHIKSVLNFDQKLFIILSLLNHFNGDTLLMKLIFSIQVGLKGEDLGLSSGSSGGWNSQPTFPKNQPLVWYKVILFSIDCFP